MELISKLVLFGPSSARGRKTMKLKMLKSAVSVVTTMFFASVCQAQPSVVGAQGIKTIGPGPGGPHTLNLNLPSGGQLYIYGAATGGGAQSSAFASGQTIQITKL